MRDQFRSDQRIARVTAPLLIMHGDARSGDSDRFGERLFALAHEPKQFVRFPAAATDDLDNFGAIERREQFINAAGADDRRRLAHSRRAGLRDLMR